MSAESLSAGFFRQIAASVSDWCDYPAVRYKILFRYLGAPYDSPALAALRPDLLNSDIVRQLDEAQLPDGSWGPLLSKDYSLKSVFPTTMVALERCSYIGLTLEDGDILTSAVDYLEDFLRGTPPIPLYNRNERAIPTQMAEIAAAVEHFKPGNPLCDRLFNEWLYVAERAFASGEYSHEKDKRAQRELFDTREDRLIELPLSLLLARHDELPAKLEEALLLHYGGHAYRHGHIWAKSLESLPEPFAGRQTRRWFHTLRYIARFRGSAVYLADAVDWLLRSRNEEGLWDYGPQTNDPWGYFHNWSLSRHYSYNRVVDCTMEVLEVLHTYLKNNPGRA